MDRWIPHEAALERNPIEIAHDRPRLNGPSIAPPEDEPLQAAAPGHRRSVAAVGLLTSLVCGPETSVGRTRHA